MINEELVRCNECEAVFDADELVMGQANDGHGIDEWSCPYCGGMNYDTMFDDEDDTTGW